MVLPPLQSTNIFGGGAEPLGGWGGSGSRAPPAQPHPKKAGKGGFGQAAPASHLGEEFK